MKYSSSDHTILFFLNLLITSSIFQVLYPVKGDNTLSRGVSTLVPKKVYNIGLTVNHTDQ